LALKPDTVSLYCSFTYIGRRFHIVDGWLHFAGQNGSIYDDVSINVESVCSFIIIQGLKQKQTDIITNKVITDKGKTKQPINYV